MNSNKNLILILRIDYQLFVDVCSILEIQFFTLGFFWHNFLYFYYQLKNHLL